MSSQFSLVNWCHTEHFCAIFWGYCINPIYSHPPLPISSMHGIFTYIWLFLMARHGKRRQIHHNYTDAMGYIECLPSFKANKVKFPDVYPKWWLYFTYPIFTHLYTLYPTNGSCTAPCSQALVPLATHQDNHQANKAHLAEGKSMVGGFTTHLEKVIPKRKFIFRPLIFKDFPPFCGVYTPEN